MKTKLTESLEDYLEAIYNITYTKGVVRGQDIADKLGVANSSVTSALKSLSTRELINHIPYETITLTDEGIKLARRIVEKHRIFKDFFLNVLAIDPDVAEACACGIEHHIPDEVADRFADFLKMQKSCRYGGITWSDDHDGFVCSPDTVKDIDVVDSDDTSEIKLSSLKSGENAKVVKLNGGRKFRERLSGMGLGIGSLVSVIHSSESRGPLLIGTGDSRFMLGQDESGKIIVKRG